MFRIVSINDLADGEFSEDSMSVDEAFFFTIDLDSYYEVYNKNDEIIGIIPKEYNMIFKIADGADGFEDIDMYNLLRLHAQGVKFEIVGTQEGSKKIKMIKSNDILRFELIEDSVISVPFTNQAFDSEGIVIFKNVLSLAESIDMDRC